MRTGRPRVLSLLILSARLRCPVCGQSSIFKAPFSVRHHCPACASLFQREEGFFVGAVMVNAVATESAALVFYFACLQVFGYSDGLILAVALPLTFLLPVLFYHHSWSVWLGFDYLVEGLPRYEGQGRGPINSK